MTVKRLILIAALVGLGCGYGVYACRTQAFPLAQLRDLYRYASYRSYDCNYDDCRSVQEYAIHREREEVPCTSLIGPRTLVALAFGQSNAANQGREAFAPRREVYNYYYGRCYRARDPLLGATGTGGSVWSRLGERLVEVGLYDRVILVTIAVGGTAMARWKPGGDMHPRIRRAVTDLQNHGLTFTHLFWVQGEEERHYGTSEAAYIQDFLAMEQSIRDLGVTAPLYVAITTRCNSPANATPAMAATQAAIHAAQRRLPDLRPGIHPGPDADAIDSMDDRHDACHFSGHGLDRFATAWLEVLRRETPPTPVALGPRNGVP
ncbi:MAG: hypothetical protein HQL82_16855 [Magnetococcales bacterium]|nr:hypothetical protein [Magnetococcales bacterium]